MANILSMYSYSRFLFSFFFAILHTSHETDDITLLGVYNRRTGHIFCRIPYFLPAAAVEISSRKFCWNFGGNFAEIFFVEFFSWITLSLNMHFKNNPNIEYDFSEIFSWVTLTLSMIFLKNLFLTNFEYDFFWKIFSWITLSMIALKNHTFRKCCPQIFLTSC